MATLLAFVTGIAGLTGGPDSAALAWVAVVPMGAVVMFRRASILLWTVVSLAWVVGLNLAELRGAEFSYALPPRSWPA
jgi:hypothetical protein